MTEKILYALVTFGAFIAAQVALYCFTYLRDYRLRRFERIDVARLARAEVANIARHMEANIENLTSQQRDISSARKVDFDKLKLSGSELIALDVSKLYYLEKSLMEDLLRLALYSRNNDLEVDYFIDNEFLNNNDVHIGMCHLKFRFERTLRQSNALLVRLNQFSQSPSLYESNPVIWEDEMFKNSSVTRNVSEATL